MFSPSYILATTLAVLVAAAPDPKPSGYRPDNFKATFGSSPAPMKVDVNPKFISETRTKVSLSRLPIDIDEPPFSEGVPSSELAAIREYWLEQYDWTQIQDRLNQQFSHFTTTVGPLTDEYNYTRPIPLHFIHHKSPREDAIPLLFVHGWPGSFLEVSKLLKPLTHPPTGQPAFHVVAPSLPGFGFSPAPTAPGMGMIEAGAAFQELMQQLGYTRYVVQGGDFGSHTARYMGAYFPDSVVSILSNSWNVFPNATDLQRQKEGQTTKAEDRYIDYIEAGEPMYKAFWGIQGLVPLQVGILLGDSPIGNLAWPYLGMRALTPGYEWDTETLITWAMMLYIPGPYGSVRMYLEATKEKTLDYAFPTVKNPVGVLQYYGDAGYGAPREWCERTGNITYFTKLPESVLGGHFPSHINPGDLVLRIRQFWGSKLGGWTK